MRMRSTTLLATLLAVGLMPIAAEGQDQGNNRPTPRQTIRNTSPEDTYEGNAESRRAGQGTLTQQRTQGTTQGQVQERQLQGTQIDGQNAQQGVDQQLSLMAAAEMAISNHCEIKMAQMAMDKVQNDQVKQFAEMMIRDHQQMNQQLMQAMPQLSSMVRMDSSAGQSERSSSLQSSQSTQLSQSTQSSQAGQSSPRGADTGTQSSPDLQAGERSQPGQADRTASTQPGQQGTIRQQGAQSSSATERATGYRGTTPGATGSTNPLVSKLVSICQETSQNSLQMAERELSEKQGKEADMCYMGSQLVMHQHTLARLQALEGEGTQEFQQIVQQAQDKVQQHLSQAKSIVETLTSESGSGQSGQSGQDGQNRSSTSPANQGSPRNN